MEKVQSLFLPSLPTFTIFNEMNLSCCSWMENNTGIHSSFLFKSSLQIPSCTEHSSRMSVSSRRREATMGEHSKPRISGEVWEEGGILQFGQKHRPLHRELVLFIGILIACPLSNLGAFVIRPHAILPWLYWKTLQDCQTF